MKFGSQNLFRSLLILAVFLSPGRLTAQEPHSVQSQAAATEQPLAAPDLADLTLLATALSSRLVSLETTIANAKDLSQLKKQLEEISVIVDEYDANQFRALQSSIGQRAGHLPQFKSDIKSVDGALTEVSKSVTDQVRILAHLRKEWLAEQQHWSTWQEALLKDEPLDEVAKILTKVHETIDIALTLLQQQLKPLLALQDQTGDLHTRVNVLTVEIEGLTVLVHGDVAIDSHPPMFSFQYFSELATAVKNSAQTSLTQISWPGKSFFARHAWIIVLQGMLFLLLALLFFRHRQQMERTEHWRFVAKRPIAAGLLVAVAIGAVFYEPPPTTVIFILAVLIGSAFARLLGVLVEGGWRKQFGYGLIALLITTNFFYALNLSLPLFRLYLLMAALVSCGCCLWWAVKSSRKRDAPLYVWALGLGSVLFAIVFFTELEGNAELAEFLFVSSLQTLGVLLVFGLLRYLMRGVLGWAVFSSSSRSAALVRDSAIVIVQRLTLIFDVLLGIVILSALLTTWQVYDSPSEAITGLLSVGVTVGSQRLTLGLVVVAIGSVGISYLVSSLLQRLLTEDVLAGHPVETGVKVAVARLVHYTLVSCGFVMALAVLGVNFTQITLLASAVGIGVGFGLQTVVNNFVCGLLLLFERPLRVGDTIEIGGQWAKISKIGLRSTTVRTFDQADVIVPNADLITHQVINWTLADRHARRTIPVRVPSGSDVPLVMQTLRECALAHPGVMKSPEPQILLRSFGDSSLNFEMRVCVADVDDLLQVESDLYQEIDRRFRQAGIQVPSQQRDRQAHSVKTTDNAAATVRVPLA